MKLLKHERNQNRVRGWLISHGHPASVVNKIGWSGSDPEALLNAVSSLHRRDPQGTKLKRTDLD
jgi:hypothetical protein